MCGIAGVLGLEQGKALPMAERMMRALTHRGPDDSGLESTQGPGPHPAVLSFTRLAIIDLSPRGHQPMRLGSDGQQPATTIVFNGEIFNFKDIREELLRDGRPFISRTDTEVILRAHQTWGEDAVERMRGMFAWCLLDPMAGTAWLCRDRLGIKPLYIARPASGGLLFASEVRALLEARHPEIGPRICGVALESYLAQGAVLGSSTIVEGISSILPGESLLVDWAGRTLHKRQYWQVRFAPARAEHPRREEAVAELHSLLRDAVKIRLVSDVPLGLFLSGGADSTALGAIATEVSDREIRTLTVGFDQAAFDESGEAMRVAAALGTRHETLRLNGDALASDIGEVFSAADQPTVDGFNTYFVSRAARRAGLTVALSGLGGDELFGGYATFGDVPRGLRLRRHLLSTHLLGPLLRLSRFSQARSLEKLRELARRPPSLLATYLLRRELLLPLQRRALMPLPTGSDELTGLPQTHLNGLQDLVEGLDERNAVSALELSAYMRHMLLRDADTFSMAVSLELRVPLLDHRIVDFVTQLPGEWKRRSKKRSKPLLLDAVGSRQSALFQQHTKRGFAFPWRQWLLGSLFAQAQAALLEYDTWSAIGINPVVPRQMWMAFASGDRRISALQIISLWMLQEYAARHNLKN